MSRPPSEDAGQDAGARGAPAAGGPRAAREAVQPSLWDRLVNDLPGLSSEIAGLNREIAAEIGAGRAEALLAGGPRAIEAEPELTPGQRSRLQRMLHLERRRADIETRGIVVSADVLREAVRRDIEALFNTERFEAELMLSDLEREQAPDDPPALADFPEVQRSVVNFGVPPFSGRSVRDFDRDALAREIRAILAAFEPRLKAGATKVTVSAGNGATGLGIEIEGLLIMTPAPERLRLRTLIDLDNGLARTELKDP